MPITYGKSLVYKKGNNNMKDIEGYEGLYAITSCGKVWSYKSKKFLKARYDKDGYISVALRKDGKTKYFFVHRLVAMAYIPNPNNLPEVNHKNEIKSDNNINNLEWCTRKYNANYGTIKERLAFARLSYRPNGGTLNAKLPSNGGYLGTFKMEEQVLNI